MYKQLLTEVRDYKWPSIISSLSMACEVIFEISLPFLMARIIDAGVYQADLNMILRYGFLMVGCALLSLLFGTLSARYGALASAGFAKNLRLALFKKVQTFSFSNIDQFSSGCLVTRMMTDVTNVQNAYQMLIRVAVRAPLNLLFAITAAFLINGRIAMIFVYVAVFLALVMAVVMRLAFPRFKKVFGAYDQLNNSIQENITNVRVVKSYVKEEEETVKFHAASGKIYDMFMKVIRIVMINNPAMMFSMYAAMIGISWMGAQLIVVGEFTTGELTSMFAYTMTILMSLMMFTMIFVMLSMAVASVERISEVLGTQADIVSPEAGVKEVKDGSIRFEGVKFGYEGAEDKAVLSDIDLTIASGEVIGILGGTGSGKSSLVQLIPRMYDVQAGSVKVGGLDVREYDLPTLRKAVAMVLQTNVLFSGTIKDNLRWGNKSATDEEIVAACQIAQADEFIRQFKDGYDTMIERGGANVSGGQRQRLCIARALLAQPKILILDDSTSAVDTKTDSLIRAGFAQSLKGTTKLIISQRISSIEDADRIIVLDDGRISGIGTHQELLKTNTIYQEVYATQTKGGQADDK